MNCTLSRTISYHSQRRFPPTKEEALLCSTCLELILGYSRSFVVFLTRPTTYTTYSRLLHLLEMTIYKMFLTCKFTKNKLYVKYCYKVIGKCYYKMGSFLFYKTGQVVLQSRVGIREWHNFYYKMGGGSIPKWGNHYKEEQDSTKGFWHLSFRATIPESKTIGIAKNCVEAWHQTMDIIKSNHFFKKKISVKTKYLKK